jgi:hypothetical protein
VRGTRQAARYTGSQAILAGQRLDVTLSLAAGLNQAVVISPNSAPTEYYLYGVVGDGTHKVRVLPLTTTSKYHGDWNPRVRGDLMVTRMARTWVAGDVAYDFTLLPQEGSRGIPPAPTATLYFSEAGQPWGFPPENYITLGIAGNITALVTLGDALVVFSKSEAWVIEGNSPSDFRARRLDSVRPGAITQDAALEWAGAAYYVGVDGLYRLTGDGSVSRVSDAIRDVFLTMGESPTLHLGVDRKRNTLYCSVNGTAYTLDLAGGRWAKAREAMTALSSSDRLFFSAGDKLYALDDESTSTSGTLETDFLDLGEPQSDKRPTHLSLVFQNDTGSAGAVVVTLTPMSGTPVTLASQAIGTGYARLRLPLPGPSLVGRGVKVKLAISGKPGLTLVAPLEFEYQDLGRRGR